MAGRMTVEGNDLSGYVGVDPMYQHYANETEKPYLTDDERELMVDHGMATDEELRYELRPGQTLEEKIKEEEEEEAEKEEADDSEDDTKTKAETKSDTKPPVKSTPAKAAGTTTASK